MQENEKNKRAVMYTNKGDTSSLKRPSLQRLRRAIRHREIDVILVTHFHILASNPKHLALLYQEMAMYDVELISTGEGPFHDTLQGQLLAGKSKREIVAALVKQGQRAQAGDQSPMDECIDGYLFGVLVPQLQRYEIEPQGRDQIVVDIDSRLHGILSRWHDADWRDTILETGREEGKFYLPKNTPLSIRAFVVVAIRNSLLGEWHVEQQYGGKGVKIDNLRMRWITAEAVRYFDACAPSTLPEASAYAENPFADLEQHFPLAWYVFSQLAQASRAEGRPRKRSKKGLAFEIDLPPLPALPELPENITRVRAKPETTGNRPKMKTVIDSGVTFQFDDRLLTLLALVRNKKRIWWYSDSWKALTRNAAKLFFIINWVLAYQGYLITPNYLLTPYIVCIRAPLRHVAHFALEGKELFAVLASPGGLFPTHRQALEGIAAQLRGEHADT